jgi:hypothetical protein
VGGSKFVVIPLQEPSTWDDHLADVAGQVLSLQG